MERRQRLACRMLARLPRRQERSFANTNTRRASAGRNAPGTAGYFKFRVYPVNAADKQIAGSIAPGQHTDTARTKKNGIS